MPVLNVSTSQYAFLLKEKAVPGAVRLSAQCDRVTFGSGKSPNPPKKNIFARFFDWIGRLVRGFLRLFGIGRTAAKPVSSKAPVRPVADQTARPPSLYELRKLAEKQLNASHPGSDLSGLDFTRVAYKGSWDGRRLDRAKLDHLFDLKLSGAHLENASCQNSWIQVVPPLRNLHAVGTNFSNSVFTASADYGKGLIQHCNFDRAIFTPVKAIGTKGVGGLDTFAWLTIEDSRFCEADLSGMGFGRNGMKLKNLKMNGANLKGADFSSIHGIGISPSRGYGAWLYNVDFSSTSSGKRTNLQESQWQNADVEKINFKNADLQRAVFGDDAIIFIPGFQGTKIRDCQFDGALLKKANFVNVNLQNSSFQGADVAQADFRAADLRGANLCGLKNAASAQWQNALYDDKTQFGPDFPTTVKQTMRQYKPHTYDSGATGGYSRRYNKHDDQSWENFWEQVFGRRAGARSAKDKTSTLSPEGQAELKSLYRRLARIVHPDVSKLPKDNAEALFKHLGLLYEKEKLDELREFAKLVEADPQKASDTIPNEPVEKSGAGLGSGR